MPPNGRPERHTAGIAATWLRVRSDQVISNI
jgi:hypothetical protein